MRQDSERAWQQAYRLGGSLSHVDNVPPHRFFANLNEQFGQRGGVEHEKSFPHASGQIHSA
jgi:hypothetical protein